MDQVLDIEKLEEFNLLRIEVREFGQQSKSLYCHSRRLEHIVDILKDPNNVNVLFSRSLICEYTESRFVS